MKQGKTQEEVCMEMLANICQAKIEHFHFEISRSQNGKFCHFFYKGDKFSITYTSNGSTFDLEEILQHHSKYLKIKMLISQDGMSQLDAERHILGIAHLNTRNDPYAKEVKRKFWKRGEEQTRFNT